MVSFNLSDSNASGVSRNTHSELALDVCSGDAVAAADEVIGA